MQICIEFRNSNLLRGKLRQPSSHDLLADIFELPEKISEGFTQMKRIESDWYLLRCIEVTASSHKQS